MNEWERLFGSQVLYRGWDYYQSGYVGKIKTTERGFTAVVEGSYEYDVSIILKDGHVTQMSCDCPYAEDGSHCKHMAAVLYKISENGFENYIRICKENREKERQQSNRIFEKNKRLSRRSRDYK